MTVQAEMSQDGRVLTVCLPLRISKKGGRKRVVVPDGTLAWGPSQWLVDSTLVKALARAHRWQRMLEEGRYASIREMAAAEKLYRGYLGRVLQLTLLAPDIVEAILDGWAEKGLPALMKPFPLEWGMQRALLGTQLGSAWAHE